MNTRFWRSHKRTQCDVWSQLHVRDDETGTIVLLDGTRQYLRLSKLPLKAFGKGAGAGPWELPIAYKSKRPSFLRHCHSSQGDGDETAK